VMGLVKDAARVMRGSRSLVRRMNSCAFFGAGRRAFARAAGARAGNGNEPRQDRAEKRQKDDRLIHFRPVSLSSN
jgi:hypothetical protein